MGQSYRDLTAWQKGMDLVEQVYRCTRAFPREEVYGLTSQIRRAAVSVPSNIAEGQARHSQKEFHHFLSHARGPLVEVETQVEIAAAVSQRERFARCSRSVRRIRPHPESADRIHQTENRELSTENCS